VSDPGGDWLVWRVGRYHVRHRAPA
jgi:hypothetical protein